MKALKDIKSQKSKIFSCIRMIPKPELFMAVLAFGLICFVVFPESAFAWDANVAALNVLGFFKTLILVGATAVAALLLTKSQIVPAVVIVVVAAFLYVTVTPEIMLSFGEGFLDLLGF